MKKWVNLSVAALLAAGLLAGCSSSGAGNKQASSSGTSGKKTATGAAETGSAKPMNISIMLPQWSEAGPSNDSAIVQKLDKKLNIKLDVQWVPGPNYKDKISVLAASGSLPDVYKVQPNDYLKWRDKGVFMDVKPYLSKYPNLTKYLPAQAYQQLNPKGHYYALPYYSIPHLFSMAVRQDWLDKLHLQMPQTVDQFYQVAKAFATQDPNHDGKQDTIGFPMVIKPDGTFGNVDFLEGAFGLGNGWALENGKLVPMQAQTPQLKDFIGFLRKAYSEGVLDKDFAVMKAPDAKKLFWEGKSGIQMVNPNEVYRLDLPKIKKADPNAEVSQMLPPKGPTGLTATHTEPMGEFKIVINAKISPDKQQRILKLLNYMLSDQGYDLIKNGVEGVDYKKNAQGQYVKMNTKEAAYQFSVLFFRRADNGVQLRKYDDKAYKDQVMKWFGNNDKYDWPNPAYGLKGETAAYKKYNFTTLDTKWMSTMVRIIMGDMPMSAIDQAVAAWNKGGGAELTKEVNQLYQQRK